METRSPCGPLPASLQGISLPVWPQPLGVGVLRWALIQPAKDRQAGRQAGLGNCGRTEQGRAEQGRSGQDWAKMHSCKGS